MFTLAAMTIGAAVARPDPFPDLTVYRAASGAIGHGGRQLDLVHGSNGGAFTYPPVAALVLWPLRLPPLLVAGVLLAAVSIAAAVVIARLGLPRAPLWALGTVVAAGLETVPFRTTIFFGQLDVLLMLLVALDLLMPAPVWPRGVLTGLAAAIKLTPAIFIVYLLVSDRRRSARTAAAAFLVVTGIGGLVMPVASWRYWSRDVWNTGRVGDVASGRNRSVWGLLVHAGVPVAVTACVCLVVGLGGLAWARSSERYSPTVAIASVGLVGCLVSPITWSHHLVWVLLAVAGVSAAPLRLGHRIILGGLITVAFARLSANAHLVAVTEMVAAAALVVTLPVLARGRLLPRVDRLEEQLRPTAADRPA